MELLDYYSEFSVQLEVDLTSNIVKLWIEGIYDKMNIQSRNCLHDWFDPLLAWLDLRGNSAKLH